MAIAHVQEKSGSTDGTNATSYALAFTSTVGSGNLVCGVVAYGASNTSTLTSIGDDKSNTYTIVRRILDSGNNQCLASFYLYNITNAPQTLTANFSTSIPYRGISMREVSGALTGSTPLDKEIGQFQTPTPGTGSNAVTSTALTTTGDGEYIFGGAADTSALRTSQFSLGTNFQTLSSSGSTSLITVCSEHLIQSSQGSIAATFTQANADLDICFMMTFKAATGGTTPINATLSDGMFI